MKAPLPGFDLACKDDVVVVAVVVFVVVVVVVVFVVVLFILCSCVRVRVCLCMCVVGIYCGQQFMGVWAMLCVGPLTGGSRSAYLRLCSTVDPWLLCVGCPVDVWALLRMCVALWCVGGTPGQGEFTAASFVIHQNALMKIYKNLEL